MDIDVFPTRSSTGGPTGMVFFRNVQVRWMPIKGDTRSPSRSSARAPSRRPGRLCGPHRAVRHQEPLPDARLLGGVPHGGGWGYVEVAGILRYMKWDDFVDDQVDLSGDATGWGVNLSSNLKAGPRSTVRLQLMFGEGVENYDERRAGGHRDPEQLGDPRRPISPQPLPIVGIVAFLDHNWNDRWSSAVGYSRTDIDNTDGQARTPTRRAVRAGQPAPHAGAEHDGRRRAAVGPSREPGRVPLGRPEVQVSFKYNFSWKLGG